MLRTAGRLVVAGAIAIATLAGAAGPAGAATVLHRWDADGTAEDAVGSADGVLVGNASFAAGRSGQAFSFDGAGDLVSVPTDASFSPAGSFTLDSWVATTTNKTGSMALAGIYECGGDCLPNADSASAYSIGVNGGQGYGYIRDAAPVTASGQFGIGGPVIADGAFHHVALMRDLAAGRFVVFVDTVAVVDVPLTGEADGPIQNLEGENDPFTIGAQQQAGAFGWEAELTGQADEVRLWDGAQSFDTTPPAPLAIVTGPMGDDGWYTGNVQVSWDLREPSVVRSSAGCGPASVTADSAGSTFSCTATSVGGTGADSVTVKRDATPPVLTCRAAPSFAQSTPGTVNATVSDGGSGPAAASVSTPADTAAVGSRSARLTARDVAGNTAAIDCPYTVTSAAPPTPPTASAPTTVAASTLAIGLPPATRGKACLSRRAFTITLRNQPAGRRITAATVQIGQRKLKVTRRAGRLTSFVDLRGRKPGRYTVRITATLSDGSRLTGTRTYRTCTPRKRSGGVTV